MLIFKEAQRSAIDASARMAFARSVADEMAVEAPEFLSALNDAEVKELLRSALAQPAAKRFTTERDLRAYVRMCAVAGARFTLHSPFCDLLAGPELGTGALHALFDVDAGSWEHAAMLDVVSRNREERAARCDRSPTEIALVPLDTWHARDVLRFGSHPDVWRLGRFIPEMSAERVLTVIIDDTASPDMARLAIVDAEGGFLGEVTLCRDGVVWRLGYWVRRDRWGEGIATAALQALVEKPPARVEPSRIVAEIDPVNAPSIAAAHKAGLVELPGTGETQKKQYAAAR